jgi:hypothetical protein
MKAGQPRALHELDLTPQDVAFLRRCGIKAKDEEPTVTECLATIAAVTGSDLCARALVEAADEVERTCKNAAVPSALPCWCFDGSL